jgi:NAD(P)H dehydrogenase (quinone)
LIIAGSAAQKWLTVSWVERRSEMLTDVALKNLKPKEKPYKVTDRDGMYVLVSTTGTVSFRLDYRLNGRRETVVLGRYDKAEIDKLLWADALILQFPLWWFAMPAILKGWVDRVFAYGFAYGVGEHSDRRWGDRYGEGTLAGKPAMPIVTAGGWRGTIHCAA